MCGIAGIIKRANKVGQDEIVALTNAMAHRGPDAAGVYCSENYALGHRRLSIIDLSTGSQPMHTEDNCYHVTYNGELYNYKELREELEAAGMLFKTGSDTEVILKAYVLWGRECVYKFRGMFAFGIADDIKKQFFIARDCLGIKPVVIYQDEEKIVFTSEIAALKELNNFNNEIDIQAIDQYLTFQYIPAPKTIFTHAKKLKPGSYVVIDYNLNISEPFFYYNFNFEVSDNKGACDEYVNSLKDVLLESIEKHLVSDVEYGAFLSGGIDSTFIVDGMSQILSHPVKTFSIGFEGDDYNELEFSSLAASINKSDHHIQVIGGDALKIVPELVGNYGEPFGDSSSVPTYYVSRLASNYVKMVLSGDGADEQFCGYQRYVNFADSLKKSQRNILDFLKYKMLFKSKRDSYFEKLLELTTYYPQSTRRALWKDDYRIDYCDNIRHYKEQYIECEDSYEDLIHQAQYYDLKEYLPNAILNKVDIASMMCGLEVRTPFVDKNVLAYSLKIPIDINLHEDNSGNLHGKWILKKMMEDKYPYNFLYRKKRGFSMPLHLWFEDPENYAYKKKFELLQDGAKIREYFNQNALKDIVNGNVSGLIWLLIVLEEWLQQNA